MTTTRFVFTCCLIQNLKLTKDKTTWLHSLLETLLSQQTVLALTSASSLWWTSEISPPDPATACNKRPCESRSHDCALADFSLHLQHTQNHTPIKQTPNRPQNHKNHTTCDDPEPQNVSAPHWSYVTSKTKAQRLPQKQTRAHTKQTDNTHQFWFWGVLLREL